MQEFSDAREQATLKGTKLTRWHWTARHHRTTKLHIRFLRRQFVHALRAQTDSVFTQRDSVSTKTFAAMTQRDMPENSLSQRTPKTHKCWLPRNKAHCQRSNQRQAWKPPDYHPKPSPETITRNHHQKPPKHRTPRKTRCVPWAPIERRQGPGLTRLTDHQRQAWWPTWGNDWNHRRGALRPPPYLYNLSSKQMLFARKGLFLVKKIKIKLFFEKKSQRRRLGQMGILK